MRLTPVHWEKQPHYNKQLLLLYIAYSELNSLCVYSIACEVSMNVVSTLDALAYIGSSLSISSKPVSISTLNASA